MKPLPNPNVYRIPHRAVLFEYPFATVVVQANRQHLPPQDAELRFRNLGAALAAVEVQPKACRKTRVPRPRYKVLSKGPRTQRYHGSVHTYFLACSLVEGLLWQSRLAHELVPCPECGEWLIEDTETGLVGPPQHVSQLGVVKELISSVAPSDGGPTHLLRVHDGAVALWSGGPKEQRDYGRGPNMHEEWWADPSLLMLHYGLESWPEPEQSVRLRSYTVVRATMDEPLVVADGYRSLLNAARTAAQLENETDIPCGIDDGQDIHLFEPALLSGEVIRVEGGTISTFKVGIRWNRPVLELVARRGSTFTGARDAEPLV